MKKLRNRLMQHSTTLLCVFCLSIFSKIHYSGFSFCLFGEPKFDDEK